MADVVEFAFQSTKVRKFIVSSKKIMGCGPTQKQRSQHERAEERWYVDQVIDVILHGDLLEEREKEGENTFVPSVKAKHKAPCDLSVGIQEQPKKVQERKKNPDRPGRGLNPRYNINMHAPLSPPPKININNVPENKEKEFVRASHVFYVKLSKQLQKSDKMVTYCHGCEGPISIQDKKFPRDMVFHFRTNRLLLMSGKKAPWVMSLDKRNCYFHAHDLACLHQLHELWNLKISDVYMDNDSFSRLQEENKAELKHRRHWDAIVDTHECVKLHRDF